MRVVFLVLICLPALSGCASTQYSAYSAQPSAPQHNLVEEAETCSEAQLKYLALTTTEYPPLIAETAFNHCLNKWMVISENGSTSLTSQTGHFYGTDFFLKMYHDKWVNLAQGWVIEYRASRNENH
jgi:hypothetical protein